MFFLFPGQGSQKAGMGQDFYEKAPAARPIFDAAAGLQGPAFLEAIFSGEQEALNHTTLAQPGLLTVECAIAQHLCSIGRQPEGCAGHSLGEIPALVTAGALAFEDALRFTVERARLMSENVPSGGMAAVMGLSPEAIEAALPESVVVANYNGPRQTIISGSQAGLDEAASALKEAGAKRVLPLKVSGPFHSPFMAPAAKALETLLAEIPIQRPSTPFISSVSAQVETSPDTIRRLLAAQLTQPVRWTQVMAAVPVEQALEVGPGAVLKGLAKRMDKAPAVLSASTLEQIAALD